MSKTSITRLLHDLRSALSPRLRTLLDPSHGLPGPHRVAWTRSGGGSDRSIAAGAAADRSLPMSDPRSWLQEIRFRTTELSRESRRTDDLLAELLAAAPEERLARVAESSRFLLLPLCKRLLRESQGRRDTDPGESENLARISLAIARRLDSDRFDRPLRNDFEARALLEIGIARQNAGDLDAAERYLERAETLLRNSCDALELAHLLNVKAALRREQRRLAEAIRLRRRARRIFQRFEDHFALRQTLIHLGEDYRQAGEPQKASATLRLAATVPGPV